MHAKVSEAYNGDVDEAQFAIAVIQQINKDLELREKNTLVFNGLSYSQSYLYNQRKAINYSPPRQPGKEREVSMGLVHEKIISFAAFFLKYIYKRRVKCYDESGKIIRGMGEIYNLGIEHSYRLERFKKKIALLYWEVFSQGDAFVLDDWQVRNVPQSIAKKGDQIITPTASGKIKILENFLSKKVKKLEPSAPALISKFDNLPQIGEEFIAGHDIDAETIKTFLKKELEIVPEAAEKKIATHLPVLKLIIKADVSGSLETLSGIIKNIKYENVSVNIINESIGGITDGDVKSALANVAIILGFKTKPTKIAENLAKAQNIKIIVSEIIYELIEAIDKEIKLIEKPRPLAEAEILKIFSRKEKKQLIGGKIIFGSIKNNSRLKILRNNEEIGFGKITSLKRQKNEIAEAKEDQECGIMFESDVQINEGDRLIL